MIRINLLGVERGVESAGRRQRLEERVVELVDMVMAFPETVERIRHPLRVEGLFPALFERLKIDPALASGPFVTTFNDVSGILIYFGTATLFRSLLLG